MARILLDTTVLIDALRDDGAAERVRKLRRDGFTPFVCAINVEELWRGTKLDEEKVVRRLLRGLRIAPLATAEGERAGRWRRTFASRGVTLHQADCLVASAAFGIGAILATANVDDFPMDELTVQRWPTGG